MRATCTAGSGDSRPEVEGRAPRRADGNAGKLSLSAEAWISRTADYSADRWPSIFRRDGIVFRRGKQTGWLQRRLVEGGGIQ